MDKLTKQVLNELSTAYLRKYISEEPKFNPLSILKTDDNNLFEKKLTWLLVQPEYMSFLAKEIFNIELMPFQSVVLTELWNRKFPMLIGSRGCGKSFILGLYSLMRAFIIPNRKIIIAGAGFRQSRFVHEYMETIWRGAPILRDLCDSDSGPFRLPDVCNFKVNGSIIRALPIGDGSKIRGYRANDLINDEFACLSSDTIIQTDDGLIEIADYLNGEAYDLLNIDNEFETPDKIFKTPKVDVYEIKTANGYSFKCSSIHQVMTTSGWKLAKDLTTEDSLQLNINDYFPSRYLEEDGIILDEKLGWLMGILLAEGTMTNRNFIQITNTDRELLDKIKNDFSHLNWREQFRPAYIDNRGFSCKDSWSLVCSNTSFRTTLYKLGMNYDISLNKTIPKSIMRSPRSVVISFLSGLFEGDGTCFQYTERGKKEVAIGYYSGSQKLIKQLQTILLKFGVVSFNQTRPKNHLSINQGYQLSIRYSQVKKLFDILDVIKWKDKFDGVRFAEKIPQIRSVTKKTTRYYLSTSIANKNKHLGTFDTRDDAEKYFYEYIKTEMPTVRVKSVIKLDQQQHLYDFHMPKTHSFIGNGFIQHNSHNKEIFETVLSGFGNVASNTVEAVKREEAIIYAKKRGIDSAFIEKQKNPLEISNQIIISGTAFYSFNHFYDYWKRWCNIVNSRGDQKKLKELMPDGVPEAFNWTDYSVLRIPYDILPKGFMDEGNIARAKVSTHSEIFKMEYGCVFSSDSSGFFKRSLIEACVSSEQNEICLPSGPVCFDAMLKGNPACRYVIGVDPASEIDNFSIVVLELHPDHRRIVHCWTTTRQAHSERVKLGLTTEDNFYSYAARRIRDLMRVFPTERIMLDSQGGGVAVNEALHEAANLKEGELPIWPVIDEDKEKPTDGESGLHIVELVNFAKSEWTSEANHGMRKDFEDKILLFPKFDPVVLALSAEQDRINEKLYDTLEDCVMEIEEMKNELSLIEITKTPNGRDRWDTPEIKTSQNKKGRMRKDRYSSLLMANMGARQLATIKRLDYESYGGFSRKSTKKENDGADFIGPAWFTEQMKGVY